ncbi:uncharacterized protein LOC131683153 isoform X3 [Topomyia yanbarensis]|uniref:uncharacterized protein LOC131683153 isoform X3 n=1 Tax=Topomyia yanbarensis TaxID=2498891 RepID=UPI00273C342F|nr:uncharacterized protein LOC131683153 isoform X3 [Topomyia yanbarensis]
MQLGLRQGASTVDAIQTVLKSSEKMDAIMLNYPMLVIIIIIICCVSAIESQSNYDSHANYIEYHGQGLPEEATLDGKVTKLDDLSPIIYLNRTKAALNCAAGSMQVELKFNEKFYGTAYANFDRNSVCQIAGKGDTRYSIELPLKGCGTEQEPQRVFTNNIVVRFHPGLEMDGDEIITIVCRYPPPVAPIPASLPPSTSKRLTDIVPASILEPPLKGIQILFVICAIMFLTLLLIGLGVSYYCLRRHPIPTVRRVLHVGSGSEITAVETGSIGSISGLKLPHAHVALQQAHSISGSEGPLIPSDYPSESQSENEELDTGSLPVSSQGSYENGAFIQDTSSIHNDVFMQTVTEKTTVEDIERHQRMITEYRAKPTVGTNWAITIRNYHENRAPEWEDFSDTSSATGITLHRQVPTQTNIPSSTYLSENGVSLHSPEMVCNMKPIELPLEEKTISNWDVLIRVLQDVEIPDIPITTLELQNSCASIPLVGQLSYDDKAKWKEIITTESTLRTMLTEAVVREDFERIRTDARYEKLFEPQSWEIIMRILAPPDDTEFRKTKKKKRETWDTRSRRSSLPTLYEYDSDGRSSVRTITQEPIVVTRQNRDIYNSSKPRSRKTSRSSYSSNNVDYRSLTEVMVDFAKPRYPENYSEGSSYSARQYYEDYEHRSMQHSSSQPSLVRSASEFTEQWIAPDNYSSTFNVSPQLSQRERNVMIESHIGKKPQVVPKYVETIKTNRRSNADGW